MLHTINSKKISFVFILFLFGTIDLQAQCTSGCYRSKQSGNWNETTSWEVSTDSVGWSNAVSTPDFNSNTIIIQENHIITITTSLAIDETIVNGTLKYNSGDLTINNTSGIDLLINGTFEDNSSAGIIWSSNTSWALSSSGTIVKTSTSNCELWRDTYEGGISSIPSSANWIFRRVSTHIPSICIVNMTYPNLIIENNYASETWTVIYPYLSSHLTLKGNLNIGGDGNYNVIFENQNTNLTKLKINGDLIVKTGNLLGIYNDSGIEIQGDIVIDGAIDFDTFDGAILLSGSTNQIIDGTNQEWSRLEIEKSSSLNTIILEVELSIITELKLSKGRIISSSSNTLKFEHNSSVNGVSDSSFVVGPVIKRGDEAFVFPIGKGLNYQPLSISAPANYSATFSAEYFDAEQTIGNDLSSTLDSISECEYWTLDPIGTSYSVYVTIGWDEHSCQITDDELMKLAHWDGAEWMNLGNKGFPGTVESEEEVDDFGVFVYAMERAINVSIYASGGFCEGEEILLIARPGNPVGTEVYSWDDGTNIVGTTRVINVIPTGITTYTLNYSDDEGSLSPQSITVYPVSEEICDACIVRNSDFGYYEENLVAGPFAIGQYPLRVSPMWFGIFSPDHFHPDYVSTSQVPVNISGNENDHTSGINNTTGYAGLITYRPTHLAREYISAKLNCPLEEDQRYKISFWASLADQSVLESAGIGFYLSDETFFSSMSYPVILTPHGYAPTPIDASGWTEISVNNYVGNGEDYITIGNFFDDATTVLMGINNNLNSLPGNSLPGSYYFIDDVSISPIPPSIEANVPTTCISSGTPVTLTASGSPEYNWSWTDSGGPHNSSGSILNVSPTESTTYTVSAILDCEACGDISSTFIITIDGSEPTATISGGGSICSTGSTEMSISFTGAAPWAVTYNDGANNIILSNITENPYTFTASQPGTYSIVSVSDQGCTNPGTGTGSAVVNNSGCDCGSPISATTWDDSFSLNPGFYYVPNNITVVDDLILSDVSISFDQNIDITIQNGASLTIDHSHLYACDDMWGGIVVEPGGQLTIINNSMIEDAVYAVDIQNHTAASPILTIEESIFNRNYINVYIVDYLEQVGTYPFEVQNNVFTSREISYTSTTWPTVADLTTLVNPGDLDEHYEVDNYTPSLLKPPLDAYSSAAGIYLDNVGILNVGTFYEMQIDGDDGTGTFNLFDEMFFGIFAQNSNFTSRNNVFQFMNQPLANFGKGIMAENTNIGVDQFRIVVEEENRFYDCPTGIEVQGYTDVQISNTDMRSTQMPVTTIPDEGELGIFVETPYLLGMEISENTITNVRNGIVFLADVDQNVANNEGQFIGSVSISENVIQATLDGNSGTPTDEYVLNGIIADNTLFGAGYYASSIFSPIVIAENKLYQVHNGIHTQNWIYFLVTPTHGWQNRLNDRDNYISLRKIEYPSSTNQQQYGIMHVMNLSARMENNTVEGFGNGFEEWYGIFTTDVVNPGLVEPRVTCNTTSNTGTGIYFNQPNNQVIFHDNTMDNNQYGFVLDNADIDEQGADDYASGNKWINFTGGNFETFTMNGSDPNNSVLWIDNSDADQVPTLNGFVTPAIPYSGTAGLSNVSTNDNTTVCSAPTGLILNEDNDHSQEKVGNSLVDLLEKLVTDSLGYGFYPEEQYLEARHHAYRMMRLQPDWVIEAPNELHEFYAVAHYGNIGRLSKVEQRLGTGEYNAAQGLLNSVQPENSIEANYKAFFTAYLHAKQDAFTLNDSLVLNELIHGCVARDGIVVNHARVLHRLLYRDFKTYFDSCDDEMKKSHYLPQQETRKFRLYPNPNNGSMIVDYFLNQEESGKLVVYSISGQKVGDYELDNNKTLFNLNEDNLENGVYLFVFVINNKQTEIERVVIIK